MILLSGAAAFAKFPALGIDPELQFGGGMIVSAAFFALVKKGRLRLIGLFKTVSANRVFAPLLRAGNKSGDKSDEVGKQAGGDEKTDEEGSRRSDHRSSEKSCTGPSEPLCFDRNNQEQMDDLIREESGESKKCRGIENPVHH